MVIKQALLAVAEGSQSLNGQSLEFWIRPYVGYAQTPIKF